MTRVSPAGFDLDALKERTRRAWSLGNYDEVARRVTWPAAPRLVDACAISAGQDTLDVAAGTGNVALLAAREGARVFASDITPLMVERGAERTAAEGLDVEWVLADAEQLPFDDGAFDCVTSAFGAMFAPRPDLVARELFRVVRPGGTVGMANWTPDSFIARQAAVAARYLPPPPGLPRPAEWGDRTVVAERFAGLAASIETSVETITWTGPSADAYVEFVERHVGPRIAEREALGPDRSAALRANLAELARATGVYADGQFAIGGDYLLVVARKRG